MVDDAVKAGLRITPSNFARYAQGKGLAKDDHLYVAPDAGGTLHNSLGWGWKPLEIIPKHVKYREWRRPSLLGFYIPLAEPRPIAAEHVVDPSVQERQQKKPTYDPPNVPAAAPSGYSQASTERDLGAH